MKLTSDSSRAGNRSIRLRAALVAVSGLLVTGTFAYHVQALADDGAVDLAVAAPQAEDAVADDQDHTPDFARDLGSGVASYYGVRFAGRSTASGEPFDPSELTAAHRTLPFGSRVRVTSKRTGKSVIVRINDRGPFHAGRVIDLSRAAADRIGIVRQGKGSVSLALLAN